jgi:hypothetical protein
MVMPGDIGMSCEIDTMALSPTDNIVIGVTASALRSENAQLGTHDTCSSTCTLFCTPVALEARALICDGAMAFRSVSAAVPAWAGPCAVMRA